MQNEVSFKGWIKENQLYYEGDGNYIQKGSKKA